MLKKKYHGADAVNMAAALSVIRYNEGTGAYAQLYQNLGLSSSDKMIKQLDFLDAKRIEKARELETKRRSRLERRKADANMAREEEKSPTYGAGMAS